MKKYIKNKYFISQKFYNKKVEEEKDTQKRIGIAFIVLNLLLFPITLKDIQQYKNKYINSNNYKEKICLSEDKINYKDINCWIENLMMNDIESATITKDGGEFEISNLDILNNIKVTEDINIKSLNYDNNGNYVLGVELNEKTK